MGLHAFEGVLRNAKPSNKENRNEGHLGDESSQGRQGHLDMVGHQVSLVMSLRCICCKHPLHCGPAQRHSSSQHPASVLIRTCSGNLAEAQRESAAQLQLLCSAMKMLN